MTNFNVYQYINGLEKELLLQEKNYVEYDKWRKTMLEKEAAVKAEEAKQKGSP